MQNVVDTSLMAPPGRDAGTHADGDKTGPRDWNEVETRGVYGYEPPRLAPSPYHWC
jgi:hypothetical protein